MSHHRTNLVNAEDIVQPVHDEPGQRDDSHDREHQPETAQQPLLLGALWAEFFLGAWGTGLATSAPRKKVVPSGPGPSARKVRDRCRRLQFAKPQRPGLLSCS